MYRKKFQHFLPGCTYAIMHNFYKSENSTVPLNTLLKKTFKQLADVKSLRSGVTGVPSGFAKFD